MNDLDPVVLPARVGDAVTARWPDATVLDVAPLPGGRSSITYRVDLTGADDAGDRVVVKVAPPGLAPVRNRDVLRQARVLRALAGVAGVRVPAVLFEDPGDPPAVPPLFAMAFVEGEAFEPIMDECARLPAPADLRGRARHAAEMLARLHGVAPDSVGLGDEPAGDLRDEVDRWVRIFDTVEDSLRPGYRACAARLLERMPVPLPSVVSHGEYRLGNTLCRGAEVTAIIDWEIWARQDPRLDLSWFLQFADADRQPSAIRSTPPGFPPADELLAAYARVRREPVPDLAWFDAHARFKQAAIAALVTKHNRRRPDPDPRQEERATCIPALVEQAMALLA